MIALFPTCLGEALNPLLCATRSGSCAAAGVAAGGRPGATCCGQPAWNSGFVADARRVARRTLRAVADARRRRRPGRVVRGDDARCTGRSSSTASATRTLAERVAPRTFELSQYLVDELRRRPPAPAVRAGVAYHDSCHMLRELACTTSRGGCCAAVADLHELPRGDRCCGFGGTFSVRYPDVSTAMADDKLASAARRRRAMTVVSADPGCIMQIEGRAVARPAPAVGSSTWRRCWRRRCERL